jgi:predicted DNA-binding protein
MNPIVIDLPAETRKRLEEQAHKVGKSTEIYVREIVESALHVREQNQPKTAREVLVALGRVQPLSERLRRKIIPGVTLDEVRAALTQANGSPLSQIILEQRGPKP